MGKALGYARISINWRQNIGIQNPQSPFVVSESNACGNTTFTTGR
jgi:hypothetical protein